MTDLDQFLSKHVDKSHLNKVLSGLTFVLKPSDPDTCTNKFLLLCADTKYSQANAARERLRAAEQEAAWSRAMAVLARLRAAKRRMRELEEEQHMAQCYTN